MWRPLNKSGYDQISGHNMVMQRSPSEPYFLFVETFEKSSVHLATATPAAVANRAKGIIAALVTKRLMGHIRSGITTIRVRPEFEHNVSGLRSTL